MITEDYLMRMLLAFFQAIMNARSRSVNEKDKLGAAEMLENAVGEASEIDTATLLSMSPESISSILQVTGCDPFVTEFMAHSLMQAATYRREGGDSQTADLREAQARAIADAYGHNMTISMDEFLDNFKDENMEDEGVC